METDYLKWAEALSLATDEIEIIFGEPLREHTSFRIGGSARVFLRPFSEEALCLALKYCRREDIPLYILGRGTNLLVSDRGVEGAVIDMTALNDIRIEKDVMTLSAGALLSSAAKKAAEASLCGLEFANGIPGTLGGALVMNAGAYGEEIGEMVLSVRVLDEAGKIITRSREEMDFGYRRSALEEGEIILSAILQLAKGEAEQIEEKMRRLGEQRRAKQPLEKRSAGSTFKRPPGDYAGRLIEAAGLKGFAVGGASISEKHAGFVISDGTASARDVYELCQIVRRRVMEDSGVMLQMEIKTWGKFE